MPEILKVRIDDITLKEATETLLQWAHDHNQSFIGTPNPEILLKARGNRQYRRVLNRADLNIPDGTGILWAAKFLKTTVDTTSRAAKILKWVLSLMSVFIFPPYIRTELRERVTGADLMQNTCRHAAKTDLGIFLLGAQNGVAEQTKKVLEQKFKGLKITGTLAGSPKNQDRREIVEKIKKSQADILFVAFGAPEQELWIAKNLKKIKNIKVAIGVGGSFDFIAGVHRRSPIWMQKLGIEWLYRLIQQPRRIMRIYNATIKFPVKILQERLKS